MAFRISKLLEDKLIFCLHGPESFHRLRRTVLVIRLQRTGRRNFPAYRLVVAEKARPVKGKFKEILGHYLPTREPIVFEFDKERVAYWISMGAIPSDTAARILTNAGIKDLDKYMMKYTKQKKRKEAKEEAAEGPPEETPAEENEPKESKEPKEAEESKEEEKKEEPPKEPSSAKATEGKEAKDSKESEEKAPEAKEEEATEEPGDKEDKKE